MKRTFYEFLMTYRGATVATAATRFADAAFRDTSFPKHETAFEALSKYVEETELDGLDASTFDTLYETYEELYLNDLPVLPLQYEE